MKDAVKQMSFEWREHSGKDVLWLSGEQGHIECGELRTELLSAIDTRQEVILDMSNISEAGTIFVQLVLSAKKQAASKGITLRVADPSLAATTAFERVGLSAGG